MTLRQQTNQSLLSILVLSLCILLAGCLDSEFRASTQSSAPPPTQSPTQPVRRAYPGDGFVAKQVEKQYAELQYSGKRHINFDPFDASLAQIEQTRVAELDGWLTSATILDIQEQFEVGTLTSEELVLYYLYRIRQYDVEQLNTILELNPDALEITQALDAERQAGTIRSNLHGIPILLKDNIATADKLHTAAGAKVLEDARSDRDAFLVTQLREAGAVILGKGNLSEWSNFMTSNSANGFSILGGQTHNPYGRFDVGGSSSGPAAAVAANFTTVSIGTETSGSLVYPASQNSVVTLKPSVGLISRDRIIPITEAQDTAGPMGRNVTDVAILLTALAGVDPNDPATENTRSLTDIDFTQFLNADGLQGLRIGVVTSGLIDRGGDAEIVTQAKQILQKAGAEVVEVELPSGSTYIDFIDILFYGMHHDLETYLQAISPHAPVGTLVEIVSFNQADLANRAPFGQNLLERSLNVDLSLEEYAAQVAKNRRAAGSAIRQTMQEYNVDLLLTLSNYLSGLYAPATFPAITIPAGYRVTGEPLGITLIGDYLADGQLIEAAYAFEQAAQIWHKPESVFGQ